MKQFQEARNHRAPLQLDSILLFISKQHSYIGRHQIRHHLAPRVQKHNDNTLLCSFAFGVYAMKEKRECGAKRISLAQNALNLSTPSADLILLNISPSEMGLYTTTCEVRMRSVSYRKNRLFGRLVIRKEGQSTIAHERRNRLRAIGRLRLCEDGK